MAHSLTLWDLKDYKVFLRQLISGRTKPGVQNALARAMTCQPAYLSRVLNGDAHLSLDQIQAAAEFFGLNEMEKEFWILLNLENRAVNRNLKAYFRTKLSSLVREHQRISNRIGETRELDGSSTEIYYSQWQIAAVHMGALLTGIRSPEEISVRLNITLAKVNEALLILEKLGIVHREKNGFKVQERLHLPSDSIHATRHHANWRLKSLERLNNGLRDGLHYTSLITCSQDDIPRIREEFIACIQRVRKIVAASPSEDVCHYSLDFFNLSSFQNETKSR